MKISLGCPHHCTFCWTGHHIKPYLIRPVSQVIAIMEEESARTRSFGLIAAAWSVVTIYCTAMIYASLVTVQRWHNSWVAPCYLLLGLMSGAILLNALIHLFAVPLAGAAHMALLALMPSAEATVTRSRSSTSNRRATDGVTPSI